nr:hypothetical protein Iba_chr04bCG9140 [Ipomoea batatas]
MTIASPLAQLPSLECHSSEDGRCRKPCVQEFEKKKNLLAAPMDLWVSTLLLLLNSADELSCLEIFEPSSSFLCCSLSTCFCNSAPLLSENFKDSQLPCGSRKVMSSLYTSLLNSSCLMDSSRGQKELGNDRGEEKANMAMFPKTY